MDVHRFALLAVGGGIWGAGLEEEMAERTGGAAKRHSASTSIGEHDALMAILVDELRVAATEAGKDGFYRMAGVLDDCGLDLRRETARDKHRLIERARQSLELWRALRAW